MSPRIQSLRMKLLRFNFTVEYIPGIQLKDADTLSRSPVLQPTIDDEIGEQDISVHVNLVLSHLPATTQRINEIKSGLLEDTTLQKVIN